MWVNFRREAARYEARMRLGMQVEARMQVKAHLLPEIPPQLTAEADVPAVLLA